MSFNIDIAGRHIPWTFLLLAAVALQWLAFAALSTFSRAKQPKTGMRASERNLIVSSAALLIAWAVAFDARSLIHTTSVATQASSIGGSSSSGGSCASLTADMSSNEVTAKIGKADEVRNDEKTRGPGAETWIYKASRCSVYLLDGKVEAVD